jgi:hypothetical protein
VGKKAHLVCLKIDSLQQSTTQLGPADMQTTISSAVDASRLAPSINQHVNPLWNQSL